MHMKFLEQCPGYTIKMLAFIILIIVWVSNNYSWDYWFKQNKINVLRRICITVYTYKTIRLLDSLRNARVTLHIKEWNLLCCVFQIRSPTHAPRNAMKVFRTPLLEEAPSKTRTLVTVSPSPLCIIFNMHSVIYYS